MRRFMTVLAMAAVFTAPAIVATSTTSAAGTATISCSIYFPQCGGGGGKPWSPR